MLIYFIQKEASTCYVAQVQIVHTTNDNMKHKTHSEINQQI